MAWLGDHSGRESETAESFKGGTSEQIALHEANACFAKASKFVHRFHPLGNEIDPQSLAKLDQFTHDDLSVGALIDPAGKVHIHFDEMRVEIGQEIEAGVAGAEIVESNMKALPAILLDDAKEMIAIRNFLDLSDLKDQPIRGKVEAGCGAQRELDASGRAVDRAGHEIDGELGAGFDQTYTRSQLNGLDSTALVKGISVLLVDLRKNNACWLLLQAAHQCLVGIDAVGFHIHDGLERHGDWDRRLDTFSTRFAAGSAFYTLHGHRKPTSAESFRAWLPRIVSAKTMYAIAFR